MTDAAGNPFSPPVWPPAPVEALLVEPPPAPAPAPEPAPEPASGPASEPAPAREVAAPPAMITTAAHAELLRLFEVVTNMCDHVIEYIETDRAERRVMLDTMAALGRTLSESAAALAPRLAGAADTVDARVIEPPEPRERVIGGSMPAGPEPFIDLRSAPAAPAPEPADAAPGGYIHTPAPAVPTTMETVQNSSTPASTATATPVAATTIMATEIAVEVRGRFGDRWVDGFEICEVLETAEGHRYRLRRHRDGVVLPELFDATSIRHVETFDQLATTNGAHGPGGNGNGESHSPAATVDDATGYDAPPVNGASNYWTRS